MLIIVHVQNSGFTTSISTHLFHIDKWKTHCSGKPIALVYAILLYMLQILMNFKKYQQHQLELPLIEYLQCAGAVLNTSLALSRLILAKNVVLLQAL